MTFDRDDLEPSPAAQRMELWRRACAKEITTAQLYARLSKLRDRYGKDCYRRPGFGPPSV